MNIQIIQDKFTETTQEFFYEIVKEDSVFVHAGQYAVFGGMFGGYEKEMREYAYNYVKLRYVKRMREYGYYGIDEKFYDLFKEFVKEY